MMPEEEIQRRAGGDEKLLRALSGCDALVEPHVIVVEDPLTTESQIYGPYDDASVACLAASRLEADLRRTTGVTVRTTIKQLYRAGAVDVCPTLRHS